MVFQHFTCIAQDYTHFIATVMALIYILANLRALKNCDNTFFYQRACKLKGEKMDCTQKGFNKLWQVSSATLHRSPF
jgi:hypothetical protein